MSMNLELARTNMIECQVRTWNVLDTRVLDVLADVRREDFVAEQYRDLAFADLELPIGHGEVMLKPVLHGRILQSLALTGGERVLEIGTGTGYLTACLARLAAEVVSVEQHADLADAARARLRAAGVGNARIEVAEAIAGDLPGGAFDVIVLTGAVYALPERLRHHVRDGGRLFAVVGEGPAMRATLFTRADAGRWNADDLFETEIPYLNHAAPPARFTL